MNALLSVPLDRLLKDWWEGIDAAHKRAFLAAAFVSVLAFGFEMTNLTLHHDDLNHLLVQKPLVGYYLGRFVHAGLFYYVQGGHFTPFLDLVVGMLLMCLYGTTVACFWGARKTIDIALIAAIVCVFPFMAQIYQYNSVMIGYPAAHLLSGLAVVLSTRAKPLAIAVSALFHFLAFSIYQAVLANAVTILVLWIIFRLLNERSLSRDLTMNVSRATAGWIIAIVLGGIAHVLVVASLNIPFDSAQGAKEAFSLTHRLAHGPGIVDGALEVLKGTRSSLVWPENYFPEWLKIIQLAILAAAGIVCILLPQGPLAKMIALFLLAVATLSPRALQFIHPNANYHNLTLTAYALLVAGALSIVLRSGSTVARNLGSIAGALLLAGYVAQCNWISTVNHLNTLAHYTTLTEIITRVRALPASEWDGRTVAVVGRYRMPADFPFKLQAGVATTFVDVGHMNQLARLMRQEIRFVAADESWPGVLEDAANRPVWPHPASVGVVGQVGLVVLGRQKPDDK